MCRSFQATPGLQIGGEAAEPVTPFVVLTGHRAQPGASVTIGCRQDGLDPWIAFGQAAEGSLAVDEGAVKALARSGSSLLSVGVTGVSGSFEAGDAVEIEGPGGLIAKGLVRVSSGWLTARLPEGNAGSGEVVVHRDDLVMLVAD